nr:hypothetical protein BaRGS_006882 [Batillaria attramentaria]
MMMMMMIHLRDPFCREMSEETLKQMAAGHGMCGMGMGMGMGQPMMTDYARDYGHPHPTHHHPQAGMASAKVLEDMRQNLSMPIDTNSFRGM